jgi:hypothetical protein
MLEGLEQTKFGINRDWDLHIDSLWHFENVEIFSIVDTTLSILSWLSVLFFSLNSYLIPEVSLKYYDLGLEGLRQTKFGIDRDWDQHIDTLPHFENVEIFSIVDTTLSILSWLSILLCNLNSSPIPEVSLKFYVLRLEGLEQTKFGINRNWYLHINTLSHILRMLRFSWLRKLPCQYFLNILKLQWPYVLNHPYNLLIQCKPLNVITVNVIIWLMWSIFLRSPKPIWLFHSEPTKEPVRLMFSFS